MRTVAIVIKKIQCRVVTLLWNEALWLDDEVTTQWLLNSKKNLTLNKFTVKIYKEGFHWYYIYSKYQIWNDQ